MHARARRATLALVALLLAACSSAPPVTRNAHQQAAQASGQSAARALSRGDLAQARMLYERALAAAEAVEDFALAGALRINLALVHARGGELAAAHGALEPLLAAPQRFGPALHAAAATRKALLYLDASDAVAAQAWAERAAAACSAPCAHAATLAMLRARLAWLAGDRAASLVRAEQALALSTQGANEAEQANALRLMGRLRSLDGAFDQAASDLARALSIDQRLGHPERVALGLVWAGELEQRRAQPTAAREYFERALLVYQAAGLARPALALRERLAVPGATSAASAAPASPASAASVPSAPSAPPAPINRP